ncbi:DoxX family protein [Arenibacter sp. F20364]|uniref:DoxX family protein n=1 Tax=Arenibacter sp. F20364 TaxID=2926415 RepID=UPI001FF55FCA|nr:DoxX family protein [Arenibacter sp. F20364]MCK0189145.1 DoxX family protein [Arenibacter sp. F20364]
MGFLTGLSFFSVISFLFFGIACFITPEMKAEYTRYGLAKFRKIVGVLQLSGSGGLVFGYYYDSMVHALAAGGLSILMILGFIVRLRIRDNFFKSAPSLFYALINALIFLLLIRAI